MVACRNDRPSLVTGWVTDAMPCVPASAVLTWPALDAVEITSMGSPEPAGKYLDSTFCAAMDGGVPRNDWAAVSVPNLNPTIPAAPAASRMAGTTHTTRRRRPAAGLPAPPPPGGGGRPRPGPPGDRTRRRVGSAEPKPGLTGQKIHR